MTGRVDPLGRFLKGEIDAAAIPGAAWWVGGPDGPSSHGARGDAVLVPLRESLTEITPFDLASLTKPLATALLLVLLERERRLTLDASLGSIFPELRPTPFAGATLRDAAAHRTGLPAWKPLYLDGSSREDYVRSIAALPAGADPGVTLYSDLGYILLGIAIERATGLPLDRAFDEHVARPLGLTRSGFPGRDDRFRDAAATEWGNRYERKLAGDRASDRFREDPIRGHVHDGNAWGLGGVAGHAGLFGTAEDVARIAVAILEPPRLGRPRGATEAMLRPVSGEGSRTVGFVLARDTESVRGLLPDDAVGHFGFTGTSLWIDPHASRVYVLLTNRVHPEVPSRDFVSTRRGFHELARGGAPSR